MPPPPPSTKAQPAAHVDGAVFKGLAMATTRSGKDRLYAADFHHGTIQVFDDTFKHLDLSGAFVDRQLPDGYAPFNVAAIGGNLYVPTPSKTRPRSTRSPARARGSWTSTTRPAICSAA